MVWCTFSGLDIASSFLGSNDTKGLVLKTLFDIVEIAICVPVCTVSLFLFFKNCKFGYSKFINTVAPTTFGIYLIHDSGVGRTLIWDKIFHCLDVQYESVYFPLVALGTIVAVFICCSVIEYLRQVLFERRYMPLLNTKLSQFISAWEKENFMKIAIINQPLANRGDEAAHKAFVRRLVAALPDCQIDVIFLYALQENVDAIKVEAENVRYIIMPYRRIMGIPMKMAFFLNVFWVSYFHPTLRKFRNTLKGYDKVICAPGGICMGGFMDWSHIWTLNVAKKLKKPIFYWGRSIGPFSDETYKKKVFKKYSYDLLRYFSYISLRDTTSVKLAKKIGITVDEVVDSAFLENPIAEIPSDLQAELAGGEYIVFVPNELTWHYRYSSVPKENIDGFYLNIIAMLEQKFPNAKIVMLPQTYNSFVNDCSYFEKLKSLSKSKNIIVIDETKSSDVQQKIIAGSKLVIGARYHSVVFAINNQIPFIALSYEHKIKGFLEKLGFTQNMVEIQDIFDSGNENLRVAATESGRNLLERAIKPKNTEAKRIVESGFEKLMVAVKYGK